ncbi:MAG: hypothetical protein KGD66_06840 [Candidatus Lokiarchaeota archaeon]|nr:hypothetical protein [Candidatus Lokiarchaeota archaeon]
METKHRFKPSIFLTSPQTDSSIYCPACGYAMEQIRHTPKYMKPIYLCPRCNTTIPEQVYGLSDIK